MLIGQPVTVLGAGIGGLAVALASARRGAVVEVIEQAEELREVGAGLQISPNGMAVLDALGVGAAVAAGAQRGRRVWLVDGIGGGTCQVSGTLHAAAFFAGLEVVERYPHSRPR